MGRIATTCTRGRMGPNYPKILFSNFDNRAFEIFLRLVFDSSSILFDPIKQLEISPTSNLATYVLFRPRINTTRSALAVLNRMLAISWQESSKVVVFKSNLAIIPAPILEWHGVWLAVDLRTDIHN
jgi:hypothetical protein